MNRDAKGTITIYDVARAAGVSITTVSRVLRGESNVSASTRAQVQSAIEGLHFRPSALARSMTSKRTNTLGIVLPKLLNPHYARVFTGASEEAQRNGYAMTLFPFTSLIESDFDLATLLEERFLDGAVILVEYLEPLQQEKLISSLTALKRHMPVVLIGRKPDLTAYPAVYHNMAQLMRACVAYLTGLKHKRIAFVGGIEADRDDIRRDVGYVEGLSLAGIDYDPSLRLYGGGTAQDGEQALNRLLDTRPPTQWPTAVIALNDLVAMGCMAAAKKHGLNVPGQLSVMGCDNLFFSPYLDPPLTTVDCRQESLGARAVQLLLAGETCQEEAEWEIIVRASCAGAERQTSDEVHKNAR
ncbi:MAG: LacI family DNA-binding transcriptional regulator [Clostridia bacterium]|nr:LacI family DNA-binding transcriptional regulator [Clostridia bacterium]